MHLPFRKEGHQMSNEYSPKIPAVQKQEAQQVGQDPTESPTTSIIDTKTNETASALEKMMDMNPTNPKKVIHEFIDKKEERFAPKRQYLNNEYILEEGQDDPPPPYSETDPNKINTIKEQEGEADKKLIPEQKNRIKEVETAAEILKNGVCIRFDTKGGRELAKLIIKNPDLRDEIFSIINKNANKNMQEYIREFGEEAAKKLTREEISRVISKNLRKELREKLGINIEPIAEADKLTPEQEAILKGMEDATKLYNLGLYYPSNHKFVKNIFILN